MQPIPSEDTTEPSEPTDSEEKGKHTGWKLCIEWIYSPKEFFRKIMERYCQQKLTHQIIITFISFLIPTFFVGIVYLTAGTKLVDGRVHKASLYAFLILNIALFLGFPGLWGEILQRKYTGRKGWKKFLLLSFSRHNLLRRNLIWLPACYISVLMYISPAWRNPWNSNMASHFLFVCTFILYIWTVYLGYSALPSLGFDFGISNIDWINSRTSKILWIIWWGGTYAVQLLVLNYIVVTDRTYTPGSSVWNRVALWIVGN